MAGELTDREHELVSLLGRCATEYKAILADDDRRAGRLRDYPWDEAEFVAHVHDLQARVMARAAARLWPERYRA